MISLRAFFCEMCQRSLGCMQGGVGIFRESFNEAAATCVEDGMDCDIYKEHIKGLQKNLTNALIETIKKQDAFLKEAIASLKS